MRLLITITTPFLLELHQRTAHAPAGVELHAGRSQDGDRVELLLPWPNAPDRAEQTPTATIRVFRLAAGLEGVSHTYWHSFPRRTAAGMHIDLGLNDGRGCSAAAFVDGRILPVDEVRLAGPSMDRWIPGRLAPELRGDVPATGRHSRYIGALGGQGVHARLRRIHALGIASARLGSAMATALARAGSERVFLVDPDHLEDHSEDAVECLPGQGGSVARVAKVHAVASFLREYAPWTHVVPLVATADAPTTVSACRACQLVFSAPDRDDARFAASLLATAWHRLHIDIGTGVFDDDGRWRAGADVRLILPGQGCLSCIGGLDLQPEPPIEWRRQRAGSLRSLNHLAVSTAMLQFERLVAGYLRQSTWTRVEVAPDGTVTTRRMPAEPDPGCALCARWAGAGDAVLAG